MRGAPHTSSMRGAPPPARAYPFLRRAVSAEMVSPRCADVDRRSSARHASFSLWGSGGRAAGSGASSRGVGFSSIGSSRRALRDPVPPPPTSMRSSLTIKTLGLSKGSPRGGGGSAVLGASASRVAVTSSPAEAAPAAAAASAAHTAAASPVAAEGVRVVPKELLQLCLNEALTVLKDFKRHSLNGLEGLAALVAIMRRHFNNEIICSKVSAHLQLLSDPSQIFAMYPSPGSRRGESGEGGPSWTPGEEPEMAARMMEVLSRLSLRDATGTATSALLSDCVNHTLRLERVLHRYLASPMTPSSMAATTAVAGQLPQLDDKRPVGQPGQCAPSIVLVTRHSRTYVHFLRFVLQMQARPLL